MFSRFLACIIHGDERRQEIFENLEDVRDPFLVVKPGKDVVVDPRGMDELVKRAASSDKTLLEFPDALHGLLCEPPEARKEIEEAITKWMLERASL